MSIICFVTMSHIILSWFTASRLPKLLEPVAENSSGCKHIHGASLLNTTINSLVELSSINLQINGLAEQ